MDMMLIWAALTALGAGILRGTVGFGSAMILVPVLSALYNPLQAVTYVLVMDCLVSLPLIPAAAKRASFRSIALLTLFALVGTIPGFYLLKSLDEETVRFIVSSVAVLFSLIFLASGVLHRAGFRISEWLSGFQSGLFGGLGALTGPPVVLHFMLKGTDAHGIRANLIMYFLVIDVVLAAIALSSLEQILELILPLSVMLGAILAGAIIGQKIAFRGDMPWYKPVAVGVITFTAISSLFLPV
ncbi:TSUP family transporter [Sneathiella sp. P13V-1]|uniref:sulfite exporter TauE/SafE family protein n=1 Tax=Sneathiella sp. P13V-1 TaxID=2697366 RepID=UPI00187B6CAE|nr:sulfite exporter TauE/SafE family protein [Sneathiella sp. P13V-1]MBE7636149.1 TSUP family transporter [Sneathiella sp. P13V-1]